MSEYKRILKPGVCHFCNKQKDEFTNWPNDTVSDPKLLCDECAEEHLTAEGYNERTGKISYKSDFSDVCPVCRSKLRGKGLHEGGGVECPNPDCNYWFCF